MSGAVASEAASGSAGDSSHGAAAPSPHPYEDIDVKLFDALRRSCDRGGFDNDAATREITLLRELTTKPPSSSVGGAAGLSAELSIERALIVALQHEDVSVARHGALAFCCLSNRSPGSLLPKLARGKLLVGALRANVTDVRVAQLVSEGLKAIAKYDHAAGGELVAAPVMDVLLAAVQLHVSDATVVRVAFQTLLAYDGDYRRRNLPVDATAAVIAGMRAHLSDSEIVLCGMRYLEQLITGKKHVAAVYVALDDKLAATLCAAVAAHPSENHIANNACWLLENLCKWLPSQSESESAALTLIRQGVADTLADIIRRQAKPDASGELELPMSAALAPSVRALEVVVLAAAADAAGFAALPAARVVASVGLALRTRRKESGQAYACYDGVIRWACKLLAPIAASRPDSHAAFFHPNAAAEGEDGECSSGFELLELLPRCASGGVDAADTLKPILSILHSLSSGSGSDPAWVARMAKTDVANALIKAVTALADDTAAVKHAVDTLVAMLSFTLAQSSMLTQTRGRSAAASGAAAGRCTAGGLDPAALEGLGAVRNLIGVRDLDMTIRAASVFVMQALAYEAAHPAAEQAGTTAAKLPQANFNRAKVFLLTIVHMAEHAEVICTRRTDGFTAEMQFEISGQALAALVPVVRASAFSALQLQLQGLGKDTIAGLCTPAKALRCFALPAVQVLAVLAAVPHFRAELLQQGALAAVVCTLGWHQADAEVCSAAFEVMGHLALGLPACGSKAVELVDSRTVVRSLAAARRLGLGHGCDAASDGGEGAGASASTGASASDGTSAAGTAGMVSEALPSVLSRSKGDAAAPASAGKVDDWKPAVSTALQAVAHLCVAAPHAVAPHVDAARALALRVLHRRDCSTAEVRSGCLLLVCLDQLVRVGAVPAGVGALSDGASAAAAEPTLFASCASDVDSALFSLPRADLDAPGIAAAMWAAVHGDDAAIAAAVRSASLTLCDASRIAELAASRGIVSAVDTALTCLGRVGWAQVPRALCTAVASCNAPLQELLLHKWRADPFGCNRAAVWLSVRRHDVDTVDRLWSSPAVEGKWGHSCKERVVPLHDGSSELELLQRLHQCPPPDPVLEVRSEIAFSTIVQRLLLDARAEATAAGARALQLAADGPHYNIVEALLIDPRVDGTSFAIERMAPGCGSPLPAPMEDRFRRLPSVLRALALPVGDAPPLRNLRAHNEDFAWRDATLICAEAWRRRRAVVLARALALLEE